MTVPGAIFAIRSDRSDPEAIERARSLVPWRSGALRVVTTDSWAVGIIGGVDEAEVSGVSVVIVPGAAMPSAEDIATSVHERGVVALEELRGDHALIAIDERSAKVHLSRDFMGSRPLCWSQNGDSTAIASEPLAIPALLGERPRENADTTAKYLAKQQPAIDATFYDGVYAVPPDSIVTLGTTNVTRTRTFTPRARPDTDDEAVALTREALDAAIAARGAGASSVACHASGGVDSGVVAASACAAGDVASLVTHCIEGINDEESDRAAQLAAKHGVQHEVVTISPRHIVDDVLVDIRAHSPTHPTFWLSGATVKHAASAGADCVLTGHLGDEWLTMAGGPLAQSVWQRDFTRVPAFARDRHSDWEESWFDTTKAVARLMASGVIKQRDYAQHVRRRFRTDGWVQRTLTSIERVGAMHDVRVEMPFGDRNYVESILGLSAWQRNRPGQPKRILREAYKDVLPPSYVSDPIKANFFDLPGLAFEGDVSSVQGWARIRELWLEEWRVDLATMGGDA